MLHGPGLGKRGVSWWHREGKGWAAAFPAPVLTELLYIP